LVLEDYLLPAGAIYAITPQGAHPTKKVRALIDHLAANLPTRLAFE
jgi:hypothetical protein